MKKEKFQNPIFIAAAVLAALIYSGVFKVNERNSFRTLVPHEKIIYLEGKVASNPVKSSSFNGAYLCDLKASFASGRFAPFESLRDRSVKEIRGSASGIAKVYFPAEFVESLYPGKLFTESRFEIKNENNFLCEQGARLKMKVLAKTYFSQREEKNVTVFLVEEILETAWEAGIVGKIEKFRALCRIYFRRLMKSWGDAGGFLLALLSGSKEYTDSSLQEGFKKAGISHILALSGMHLSIFSGIAVLLGNKAFSKRIADFLRLVAVTFFVWFAGLSPSLFRAFLCAMIVFFANVLRIKKPRMLNVLSVSFILQILIFPEHAKSVAFMLSYGALAGILIFSPVVRQYISSRFFPKLASSFAASISAQSFTLPVTVKMFGAISTAGVPASVLVSPLVTTFIYVGLLATALSIFVPFMRVPCALFVNVMYALIKWSVGLFRIFPFYKIA